MYESFQGDKQMKRETAEKIIHDMIKPLYGFALKRCRTPQDAEDLAQEIAFKAFRSLTANGDIESPEKFIWTIAHNALSNYYRDKSKMFMGIPIDDLSETLRADGDAAEELIRREDISRLQKEIAYLSKIQRQIVIAYYYENKKQEEIADNLSIPLGTVKWHLFEAKKDLKKGISAMRETSELKFNPIKFKICGTSGSVGTKGSCSNFFRSTLSQNIVYSVWKIPKTVNEIADDLGVSPVYVESEAEYLYEYGFLIKAGGKYLCNILLDEPSDKINRLHDEMYKRAAKLFANELYDELSESPLLDDESVVVSSRMTGVKDDRPVYEHDRNFMLWALIPYIASVSGEQVPEIKPEEALTIRPDGGRNICYASVVPGENAVTEPEYFGSMQSFCGPCWNSIDGVTLWQCDSEWSKRRIDEYYQEVAEKSLSIIKRFIGDSPLSRQSLHIWRSRDFYEPIRR